MRNVTGPSARILAHPRSDSTHWRSVRPPGRVGSKRSGTTPKVTSPCVVAVLADTMSQRMDEGAASKPVAYCAGLRMPFGPASETP